MGELKCTMRFLDRFRPTKPVGRAVGRASIRLQDRSMVWTSALHELIIDWAEAVVSFSLQNLTYVDQKRNRSSQKSGDTVRGDALSEGDGLSSRRCSRCVLPGLNWAARRPSDHLNQPRHYPTRTRPDSPPCGPLLSRRFAGSSSLRMRIHAVVSRGPSSLGWLGYPKSQPTDPSRVDSKNAD